MRRVSSSIVSQFSFAFVQFHATHPHTHSLSLLSAGPVRPVHRIFFCAVLLSPDRLDEDLQLSTLEGVRLPLDSTPSSSGLADGRELLSLTVGPVQATRDPRRAVKAAMAAGGRSGQSISGQVRGEYGVCMGAAWEMTLVEGESLGHQVGDMEWGCLQYFQKHPFSTEKNCGLQRATGLFGAQVSS